MHIDNAKTYWRHHRLHFPYLVGGQQMIYVKLNRYISMQLKMLSPYWISEQVISA